MGNLHAQEFAEMGDMGLQLHLSSNFYPPLPAFVKESTIQGINDFNDGKITIEQLAEKCYLRSVDAVYRYHGVFLTGDDYVA